MSVRRRQWAKQRRACDEGRDLVGPSGSVSLDIIPTIEDLFQRGPQPDAKKLGEKMSAAKTLSISSIEIHNVKKFYREGDEAHHYDEWYSTLRIEPPEYGVSGKREAEVI